jgi:hypothetical protein
MAKTRRNGKNMYPRKKLAATWVYTLINSEFFVERKSLAAIFAAKTTRDARRR